MDGSLEVGLKFVEHIFEATGLLKVVDGVRERILQILGVNAVLDLGEIGVLISSELSIQLIYDRLRCG